MSDTSPTAVPTAQIRARRRFQLVWLIPLIAVGIAAYLGGRAIAARGPDITIVFRTADGLQAGQTKVRHKAVDLGTVQAITLADDLRHVIVQVRMVREATRMLTSGARFWVVRPRVTSASVSGLETVLSGAYVELDPGTDARVDSQRDFTGLEEPPVIRSDEPGTAYRLRTARIGSIGAGTAIYYHNIAVGEVLGFDTGGESEEVVLHAFVRAPFDKYIRPGTRFWDTSGIAIDLGAQGIQLRVESLQAVLSGGITFDTPKGRRGDSPTPADSEFPLFKDEATANAAGYTRRVPLLVRFDGSVRGLSKGAPVEMFGLQIGNVTDITLNFDLHGKSFVAVRLEIQPERIFGDRPVPTDDPMTVTRELASRGMRAGLRTANYLTGQQVVSIEFLSNAPPAQVEEQDGAIVLPATQSGGLDAITTGASQLLSKIDSLPLQKIADNLNDTLRGVAAVTNAPELHRILQGAATTMAGTEELIKRLEATAAGANRLVASADAGYGENSEFRRDIQRLLTQVSDTARSVRLLADYLDAHPESLIRGRRPNQ